MRRVLVSGILLCFIATLAMGQRGFDLGIKAGLNAANIASTAALETTRYGITEFFHAGFFSSIPVTSRVILRPELLYSVKGAQYAQDRSPMNKSRISHGYLVLPLLVGYKIGAVTLDVGPEIGYKLNTTIRNPVPGLPTAWDRRFDFSIDGGVTAELNRVVVSLRFVHGLSSLTDPVFVTDSEGRVIGTLETQNRVFQLSAGFKF